MVTNLKGICLTREEREKIRINMHVERIILFSKSFQVLKWLPKYLNCIICYSIAD